MNDDISSKPWTDAAMLDCAFAWLTSRARRLTLEREIRDAARNDTGAVYRLCDHPRTTVPDDDAAERLTALRALEEQQHGELHARREAHRADRTARPLGLDRLVLTHELGEDEEMILLTVVCGAISEEMSNILYGDLAVGFYGNATLEGVSRMLDARTTADRLRVRRLLAPDAPLVKGEMIVVDLMTNRPSFPDDLLGARLRITEQAFATLVGEVSRPAPEGPTP
jgi:hypothetical protein